jgi:hypothetical protein
VRDKQGRHQHFATVTHGGLEELTPDVTRQPVAQFVISSDTTLVMRCCCRNDSASLPRLTRAVELLIAALDFVEVPLQELGDRG